MPICSLMMASPVPEADRRRLVEVRGLHPAIPVLLLHPLLSIVTGFGREASDTVVEGLGRLGAPLGPTVTGTVEIDGRILELPGALTDVAARPEVVRAPMLVSELGRRRATAAAMDVSQRAARVSRREAGLARRDQLVDRLEQLSNRADVLERQLERGNAVGAEHVERLLLAVRLPASPNPIVTALLDEWDSLVAERKAGSGGPTVERAEANLESIRARIAERQSASAGGDDSATLSAAGVARVQAAHAEVEHLAAGLEDGRRAERKAAARDVGTALDAEHDALVQLGFDSFAAFLLAMAEGRAEDDAAHDDAALLTAESALSRARDRESAFVVLSERELDLRARVARLLGRLPGPDVGAELRTGREKIAAPSGALDSLLTALREADVAYGDDPVAAAEHWLATAEVRRGQHAALRAELAEIESEGSRLDEQLEMAENELAAAERELIAGVSGSLAGREAPVALASTEPHELAALFHAIAPENGPPLVIGECFAELSPECGVALLAVLGEISRRRQVIVVTEHEAVGGWAQGIGFNGVVWTPADADAAQRALRDEDAAAEAPPELMVEISVVEPQGEIEIEVEFEFAAKVEVEVPAAIAPEPEPEPAGEQASHRNDVFDSPESREAGPPPVAPGPWKRQARPVRKNKNQPAPPPWEGRFDTNRERALQAPSGSSVVATPVGTDPLAVCARHVGVMTRKRCSVCNNAACDECLVKPWARRKPICIECALRESGVRKRRRLRG